MDREAWHAAIHGVTKSRTRLSDWTELNWTEHHYRHWDHMISASPSASSTFSSQLLWLCVCHRCLGRMSWSSRLQNMMPIWYWSWLWCTYSPKQTLEHGVRETHELEGGKWSYAQCLSISEKFFWVTHPTNEPLHFKWCTYSLNIHLAVCSLSFLLP